MDWALKLNGDGVTQVEQVVSILVVVDWALKQHFGVFILGFCRVSILVVVDWALKLGVQSRKASF